MRKIKSWRDVKKKKVNHRWDASLKTTPQPSVSTLVEWILEFWASTVICNITAMKYLNKGNKKNATHFHLNYNSDILKYLIPFLEGPEFLSLHLVAVTEMQRVCRLQPFPHILFMTPYNTTYLFLPVHTHCHHRLACLLSLALATTVGYAEQPPGSSCFSFHSTYHTAEPPFVHRDQKSLGSSAVYSTSPVWSTTWFVFL